MQLHCTMAAMLVGPLILGVGSQYLTQFHMSVYTHVWQAFLHRHLCNAA